MNNVKNIYMVHGNLTHMHTCTNIYRTVIHIEGVPRVKVSTSLECSLC